ncbi:hypothetical protein PRIPAC_75244 [Pristionchus pacificus]|uniref:Uncharacterized protein n=1 Tax=Pristionchus pacificus TaxID=54126 RepID=A0A2A6CSF4_PRIPA|nr:hypothetical protein PRIPAC_75244 [Pristionchus pacificus]|eukprot:PDM81069.1 hypothetical protein PRIPAC_36072 [Pristionchus pacificus]
MVQYAIFLNRNVTHQFFPYFEIIYWAEANVVFIVPALVFASPVFIFRGVTFLLPQYELFCNIIIAIVDLWIALLQIEFPSFASSLNCEECKLQLEDEEMTTMNHQQLFISFSFESISQEIRFKPLITISIGWKPI